MPFGVSLPELLILLVVLLLVFGAKRLPEMGKSLGKGMREFKDAVSGEDEPTRTPTDRDREPGGASPRGPRAPRTERAERVRDAPDRQLR